MACRCNEISKCERDISVLTGEIARKLNSVQTSNNNAMRKISPLINSLSEAISINNMAKIEQRFSSISKKQDGFVETLQSKRTDELRKVRTRLRRYEDEDRSYHEKEAQKVIR